jgi:hypothetical protein
MNVSSTDVQVPVEVGHLDLAVPGFDRFLLLVPHFAADRAALRTAEASQLAVAVQRQVALCRDDQTVLPVDARHHEIETVVS